VDRQPVFPKREGVRALMEGIEVTNDELNKFIHETVIGECRHEMMPAAKQSLTNNHGNFKCVSRCGEMCHVSVDLEFPDYCSSLDAAAKAEAKAIEEKGQTRYLDKLSHVIADGSGPYTLLTRCAIATARQRCEAIYQLYTAAAD
jgi:hypothetical protein